jgi:DNA repair ATPase RecN
MTDELAELKQRQEQLEQYVNLLEARVDLQESLMRLYTAGREPSELPDPEDGSPSVQGAEGTRPSEGDPQLKGFDYLLRTILTQQGMHSTDLRKAIRGQELLQSRIENATGRLDSIGEIARDVDRKVQTIVRRLEAR